MWGPLKQKYFYGSCNRQQQKRAKPPLPRTGVSTCFSTSFEENLTGEVSSLSCMENSCKSVKLCWEGKSKENKLKVQSRQSWADLTPTYMKYTLWFLFIFLYESGFQFYDFAIYFFRCCLLLVTSNRNKESSRSDLLTFIASNAGALSWFIISIVTLHILSFVLQQFSLLTSQSTCANVSKEDFNDGSWRKKKLSSSTTLETGQLCKQKWREKKMSQKEWKVSSNVVEMMSLTFGIHLNCWNSKKAENSFIKLNCKKNPLPTHDFIFFCWLILRSFSDFKDFFYGNVLSLFR
jgi:hypothetical protein